jgi:POT family proton-dependent oligopeptide transporter
MIVLVVLLVASAMFWAGFEQAGSSLNLFASDYTQRQFAGIDFVIPAGWFQSLNPVFIIVLAPVVASVWTGLARRGRDLSIPTKFALGLILLGLGFLIMAGASSLVGPGKKVLPTWLIGTYLVHTVGELCLSPVGLSAVTKLAPQRLVGQMMGMWFLASALGLLIAGLLAGEIAEDVTKMPQGYMQIVWTSLGAGVVLLIFVLPLKWLIGDLDGAKGKPPTKKPPAEEQEPT